MMQMSLFLLQNLASMVGNVAFEYCPAVHMLNVFQNQREAYQASEVRYVLFDLERMVLRGVS